MKMMPFSRNLWNPWLLSGEDFLQDSPCYSQSRSSTIRVNLYESPENYMVLAQVGSFTKEDLKISFRDSYLEIQIQQKNSDEQENTSLGKSIYLENRVNPDNIIAEFQDGILKITLEKMEREHSRTIDIA